MRVFKFVIIFIVIVLISGCSIDYSLFISDKYIDENINIVIDDTAENRRYAYDEYEPLHHSEDIHYQKSVDRKKGKINIKMHYRYNLKEFINANSFNEGFYDRNVRVDGDLIDVYLNNFSGFAADVDFDIKIKTNNKVIYNNANKVKNNTYIWHVTSKNKDKLNINIKIKKNEKEKQGFLKSYGLFIVFSVVILAILLIIGYGMYKKIKKCNKF